MKFSAKQIQQITGGELSGDEQVMISTFAKIEEGGEEALCFIANPKYEGYAQSVTCGLLIVRKELKVSNPGVKAIIHCEDPYLAFTTLLQMYDKMSKSENSPSGINIHPKSDIGKGSEYGSNFSLGACAVVGNHVKIGNNVKIFPNCSIGDYCKIGDDTILYSGVHVYKECEIGSRVVIHSGAIIGADGFGFAPQQDGSYLKIPQTGNVVIKNDVEIGANTTIDRATIGSTIIGEGVKLDNLIQVGHNVEIGDHTVIAAQVGISGSTKLGKKMMIGGQAGFTGHIKVADGSKIQAKAAVISNIEVENKGWSGIPAIDVREHYRILASMKQLPELIKKVKLLEDQNSKK